MIDTNILGPLCHSKPQQRAPVEAWLTQTLDRDDVEVFLPAIADYELRRKLEHLALRANQASTQSLKRLDMLRELLTYVALDDETLQRAARLWAQARHRGEPTASVESLDGDVILAAQALSVGATVLTMNARHLSRYVAVEAFPSTSSPAKQVR